MAIECSFCSTGKSQQYLYTECGHLVCVNCAALRASDSLQCCDMITQFDKEVKAVLREKKEKILNNLENKYKYERTDVNKMGLAQLEERLKNINELESRPKRKYQEDFESQILNSDSEELKETPMNEFYNNPLILQEQKIQIPDTTPIKRVQCQEEEEEERVLIQQKVSANFISEQKALKQQAEPSKKKERAVNKLEFCAVLEKNMRSVRAQFKGIYDNLQKMEANMVYQMKIYFEEYINLIEKENSVPAKESDFVEDEMERINNFLDQFVQEWSLKDIAKLVSSKEGLMPGNMRKEQPKQTIDEMADKRKVIYSNSLGPLESCGLNQGMSKKLETKEDFSDRLRLSESLEGEVKRESMTGRNLQKIYKKLEESRSKLQERIQIHNEFMTRRCVKLGSY